MTTSSRTCHERSVTLPGIWLAGTQNTRNRGAQTLILYNDGEALARFGDPRIGGGRSVSVNLRVKFTGASRRRFTGDPGSETTQQPMDGADTDWGNGILR